MFIQQLNRSGLLGVILIYSGLLWAESPITPTDENISSVIQQATNGDIKAQAELADRYYKGDGITQDYTQAAFWFEKLAETGVAQAQTTLALIYIRGNGVTQDNEKAVYWLTQAAEQRLPEAQYLLGVAYAEGHGVEQDLVKAFMWYEIAAALEYKFAVTAQADLKNTMKENEIAEAEQMAAHWWNLFHQ